MTDNAFCNEVGWIPDPAMSPAFWLRQHHEARKAYSIPRDSRIPTSLGRLAGELCALRFALEQIRLAFGGHPEAFEKFRESLLLEPPGLFNEQSGKSLARLISTFFSRVDWREHDILEMMLEHLRASVRATDGAEAGAVGDPGLKEELHQLDQFGALHAEAYEQAVQGLISEARGSLIGLLAVCNSLKEQSVESLALDEGMLRLLVDGLTRTLGIRAAPLQDGMSLPEDPAELWGKLLDAAGRVWSNRGIPLPLKPLEKAALYLLESLPIRKKGHAGFVRYLIEGEDAYRRLLSAFYAPFHTRAEQLLHEVDAYNRLPEHASRRLDLDENEVKFFSYALMLRPDVVAAIVEREQQKDIYKTISGLGAKAHLPRVLHEIQNIFGYITPEAVQGIAELLKVEPVDIIRLIASYKQFSADRGGDIIIYICKGTACFLRGQPELSRRVAEEIMADEGRVGKHGIQFIEMDCFGVCHLAPVLKTRDTFLGRRKPGDIPDLLDQLLKGPSYENRLAFLDRVQRMLAPGHESDPMGNLLIKGVIGGEFLDSPQAPGAGGEIGGRGLHPERSHSTLGTVGGQCLLINASGHVFASDNSHRQLLGRLAPHSLCFHYSLPDRSEQLGALVLDSTGQIESAVHFPCRFLEADLRLTLKPRAHVAEGSVWVDRVSGPLRLGSFTANALVVLAEDGAYRLIELSGPPNQAPPEKEEGLKVHGAMGQTTEENEFLRLQDRLLLGFASGTNPEDVDSYVAHGGYTAVRRVLGLAGEAPWSPGDIVDQVALANLRGRGGAGFPTGRKWEAMRQATCTVLDGDENRDSIKLIVANGDEGDPGAFMDRTLIQERPHQVLEGMILAAIAVGARYGVIYVRKEYEDAVRRLENAIFQARRKGYLGQNIFGVQGLHFDVDIRLGAGAFVAGEKRAIMRAIEGEAAEPTLNAASNTYRGLWGKPTLLNNVETFANVPLILQRGAKWYAGQGTENTGGSKIFSVAGIVKRTGLVEVRFGRTLQDIITICGGIQEGKHLAGVQIGGPSGAILSLTGIRSYLLYTPLDFDAFDHVGAMLGSGGLVFIGEDDDVVRLARHFTDWLAEESCGQCPACFQGTRSLGANLDVILLGEGTSDHLHALWAKSDAIKAGSQCGLGMTASNPVTSALRFFPHAFLHYVLSNTRMDRLELFKSLEALRLITREDVQRISGRRRELVGHSFTLRKHLMRNLVAELERVDTYRPSHLRQSGRFLDLLQVGAHELGSRDAILECAVEELERG